MALADLSVEMQRLSDNAEAAGLTTFQMVGHTGRRRSIVSTAITEGFTLAEDEFPIRFSSADSVVTLNAGQLTLGPELVVNGDFADPGIPGAVPGWTGAAGLAALTVVAGQLHVEALETQANQTSFQSAIPTTIGQSYRFSAESVGSVGHSVRLLSADATPLFESGVVTGTQTFGPVVVVAIETSMAVLLDLDNVFLGEFAEFDNISLKLVS